MKKLILFVFVLLMSASSFADDCFWRNMVSGFTNNDQGHLVVNVGGAQYNVEVSMCFELPRAINIAFDSFGERVCRGDRLLILDNFSGHVIQRCSILKIEQM
jgi:hypothetical protein